MKKISTLFKKDPNYLGRVINEVNPENQWVFDGDGVPTQKFDGTATAIFDGKLYKRFDVKLFKKKKGKITVFTDEQIKAKIPEGAIPCQKPDEKSGHFPHWIICDKNDNSNKYHFEAFDKAGYEDSEWIDGTYELCGEKVQGNPENVKGHKLIPHGGEVLKVPYLTFEGIKTYLENHNIEGIVFHHKSDGRMCKIRKTDFGIERTKL